MAESVVQFPTAPLEKNTKRHWNEMFARMQASGMTQEQMQELMLKTLKEGGFVEIDGVWQLPGSLPPGWKWPGNGQA